MTALLIALLAGSLLSAWVVYTKNLHIWLPAYLYRKLIPGERISGSPVHVLLCIADHFEPRWNGVTREQEDARVDRWYRLYPEFARHHRGGDGVPLQHTFFYPEEEYRPEHLDKLAKLRRQGLADVEIHLHHENDTPEDLRTKLVQFAHVLRERHGLLHRNQETGAIEYAFIHGDWALDDSGGGRHCGVRNELAILSETGCYADFTLPAAPEPMQTRKINSIYYAQSNPARAKSHDTGKDSCVGRISPGLLLIQGPLALNWKHRKFYVLPRIENGELSFDNPPSPARADLWIRQGIHVQGRPDWVFVKLHTHGANERNASVLLGKPMDETLRYLEMKYNDKQQYVLHYITAREMYQMVRAAEAGMTGNPHRYRTLYRAALREACV